MELAFKQDDTHNAIVSVLTKDGEPIDLTDCTALISVSDIVCDDECIVLDAVGGKVAYPVSNITENSGWFDYEFTVKYADGTREIVPNKGYKKIRVYRKVGDC